MAAKIKKAMLDFSGKGTKLELYFSTGATSMKFLPVNYKEDWALVRATDDAIGYKYAVK